MRKFIVFLILVIITGCSFGNDGAGSRSGSAVDMAEVRFIPSFSQPSASRQLNAPSVTIADATKAIISIDYPDGTTLFVDKEVPLYHLGTQVISSPMSLPVGELVLKTFLLADASGNILYAVPVSGSDFANFVSTPLPVNITVSKDSVTTVPLQVVQASIMSPEDFGYISFDVTPVETIDLYLALFEMSSKNSRWILTDGDVEIIADNVTVYSGYITNSTTQITVPGRMDMYTITAVKAGYADQTLMLTGAEMFNTTRNNPIEILFTN